MEITHIAIKIDRADSKSVTIEYRTKMPIVIEKAGLTSYVICSAVSKIDEKELKKMFTILLELENRP